MSRPAMTPDAILSSRNHVVGRVRRALPAGCVPRRARRRTGRARAGGRVGDREDDAVEARASPSDRAWLARVVDPAGRVRGDALVRRARRTCSKAARDLFELLPDPQQHGPRGRPPPCRAGRTSARPSAVYAAALYGLREASSRGPVLVALDDVQWLDVSTTDALEFAVRRLDDGADRLVWSPTRGAGTAAPARPRSRVAGGTRRRGSRSSRCRSTSCPSWCATRLDAQLPPSALKRLHEMSGGNPFFALEIARATLRGDTPRHGSGAARSRGTSATTSSATVWERSLRRCRRLLLYAAACVPADRRRCWRRPRTSRRSSLAARRPRTPGSCENDGEVITFTHPVYRSAIYAEPLASIVIGSIVG